MFSSRLFSNTFTVIESVIFLSFFEATVIVTEPVALNFTIPLESTVAISSLELTYSISCEALAGLVSNLK